MKINSPVDSVNGRKAESSAATGSQPGVNGAKSATVAPEGTTIHLSSQAATVKTLAASLAAEGQFDAKKVDAIKQAIRDGQLRVDPEVIADRMLNDLRDAMTGTPKA